MKIYDERLQYLEFYQFNKKSEMFDYKYRADKIMKKVIYRPRKNAITIYVNDCKKQALVTLAVYVAD